MSRPLYIFDLDGTLALIDHRRPILDDESLPKDERWRRFFAACVDDVPNKPVIRTLRELLGYTFDDAEIWIWSARSNEVETETRRWIKKYVSKYIERDILLKMRCKGDFTPDVELKQTWLNAMLKKDRKRLVAVFDDRNSVCQMYRKNGVTVFQVAEADF